MKIPFSVKLKNCALRTKLGYNLIVNRNRLNKIFENPDFPYYNSVLKTSQEYKNAFIKVKSLGLPPHPCTQKNWDSLAALDCILKRTNKDAKILDGGTELYSMILPWLSLYGYKNLRGINLIFKKPIIRDPIKYEYGDITATKFGDESFDAVTSLSVIEHGIELNDYFKEMSRILKPGGILITSTDYFAEPINTKNKKAFGVPIRIFSENEIKKGLSNARNYGLELISPLNLSCKEKIIKWKELEYTFLIFTLQKKNKNHESYEINKN